MDKDDMLILSILPIRIGHVILNHDVLPNCRVERGGSGASWRTRGRREHRERYRRPGCEYGEVLSRVRVERLMDHGDTPTGRAPEV